MANHCGFCDTRRPSPTPDFPHGTKIMVLGEQWFEFCEDCSTKHLLTNEKTGEEKSLAEVWELVHTED